MATLPNIIAAFVSSQIVFVVMSLVTLPIITRESEGLPPFDTTALAGYDYDYATRFVAALSSYGKTIYLYVQEPLDVLFPLLSAAFIVLSLTRLGMGRWAWAGFIPMVLDYIENIMVIIMLTTSFGPPVPLVSSAMTQTKAVVTMVLYLLLVILFIRYLWRRRRVPCESSTT